MMIRMLMLHLATLLLARVGTTSGIEGTLFQRKTKHHYIQQSLIISNILVLNVIISSVNIFNGITEHTIKFYNNYMQP